MSSIADDQLIGANQGSVAPAPSGAPVSSAGPVLIGPAPVYFWTWPLPGSSHSGFSRSADPRIAGFRGDHSDAAATLALARTNNLRMAPPLPPSKPKLTSSRPATAGDASEGFRQLRRHHEATLQYHERRLEVKFVIDGATGDVVLPADPGFASELGGRDAVLHMPQEAQCHLQVAIAAAPISRPEAEEAVDRWHAYHAASGPTARGPRAWLRCRVDGGKVPDSPPPGEVYPAEALARPNGLRKAEPRLVKLVNTDRDAIARACRHHVRMEVTDPLCVGVDPFGLDIRARFGIVRIEFDLEAATAEQAEDCIRRVLA